MKRSVPVSSSVTINEVIRESSDINHLCAQSKGNQSVWNMLSLTLLHLTIWLEEGLN